MYLGKIKIAKLIKDISYDINSWRKSKALPIDDFLFRASDTKDFLSAVNELVKKTLIIPSYHKGKSQERVYLADNKNNFLHIGYKEGDDYLLDRDLVYNETMKITGKKYLYNEKSKRIYFWDLLCDRIIKPHRRCYVLRDGKIRPCICIPDASELDDYISMYEDLF